jgi:hypothetical protein
MSYYSTQNGIQSPGNFSISHTRHPNIIQYVSNYALGAGSNNMGHVPDNASVYSVSNVIVGHESNNSFDLYNNVTGDTINDYDLTNDIAISENTSYTTDINSNRPPTTHTRVIRGPLGGWNPNPYFEQYKTVTRTLIQLGGTKLFEAKNSSDIFVIDFSQVKGPPLYGFPAFNWDGTNAYNLSINSLYPVHLKITRFSDDDPNHVDPNHVIYNETLQGVLYSPYYCANIELKSLEAGFKFTITATWAHTNWGFDRESIVIYPLVSPYSFFWPNVGRA